MTYIFDTGKNQRQKITSYSEKGLYQKLYEFYYPTQKESLQSLYSQWVEKRKAMQISDSTIHRNQNDWDKYYRNSRIVNNPIDRITIEDIESFFYECISNYHLTRKALNNMKLIFKELMKLSKKKGLISTYPFDDIELNLTGCEPPNNPKDTSRVYLPDEIEILFENGELRPVIHEYTKKKSPHGNRYLPLSDYEISLFQRVKEINLRFCYSDDDFIFCDENGRTKIREIDNCIRTQCTCADIPVKSAHDIPRTVASELYNEGVSLEIIRQYLGHSSIQTTRGYILNNRSKLETNALITSALNNLNGINVLIGTQQ